MSQHYRNRAIYLVSEALLLKLACGLDQQPACCLPDLCQAVLLKLACGPERCMVCRTCLRARACLCIMWRTAARRPVCVIATTDRCLPSVVIWLRAIETALSPHRPGFSSCMAVSTYLMWWRLAVRCYTSFFFIFCTCIPAAKSRCVCFTRLKFI